jgi:hypothetical protein
MTGLGFTAGKDNAGKSSGRADDDGYEYSYNNVATLRHLLRPRMVISP